MTVKRYTPTQCCEYDGTYVTYSDYQKLVAENSALKESQGEVYDYTQKFTSSDDREMWNAMHDIYKLSSPLETPATDAAIAEIKAQGVDELAAIKKDESEKSGSTLSLEISIAAKVFAANLRAGREG